MREPRLEKSQHGFPTMMGHYRWWDSTIHIEDMVIGFCGKIYPVIRLKKDDCIRFCHTLEDVDQFFESINEVESYQNRNREKRRRYSPSPTRQVFAEFFERMLRDQNRYGHIFLEQRCPIFMRFFGELIPGLMYNRMFHHNFGHRASIIVYNPILKPFEFVRVFDPYRAFQELQMFWGGMAHPEKEIPVPSDKDMVSIKGFDKWSFRKMPND